MRSDGIDADDIVNGLTNEIAIAIQRGNAKAILNCVQQAAMVVADPASAESVAASEQPSLEL